MRVLTQKLRVAAFKRMSPRQMEALRARVCAEAEDGRSELYRTTAKHFSLAFVPLWPVTEYVLHGDRTAAFTARSFLRQYSLKLWLDCCVTV